jgi:uncharacterized UPF0146 family protein
VQEESALYRFAERRKVVVVGGGFSGRKVAMKLQSSFDVTLVDNKDHFMCIISLPACLCDTDHLEKVTAPHTKVRCGTRARSSLTCRDLTRFSSLIIGPTSTCGTVRSWSMKSWA